MMSTHARTALLIAAAIAAFALGSLQAVPRLVSGTLILLALALGAAAAMARCPSCGARVMKRPATVFGRTVRLGASLFHSHCYFCGNDLRRVRGR